MKSQGLPMQTVALIVIAVIAFVILLVFFMFGFGSGKDTSHDIVDISSNKTVDTKCLSAKFGGCPHDKPYCEVGTGNCVANCHNSPYTHTCEVDKTCVDTCTKCSDSSTCS